MNKFICVKAVKHPEKQQAQNENYCYNTFSFISFSTVHRHNPFLWYTFVLTSNRTTENTQHSKKPFKLLPLASCLLLPASCLRSTFSKTLSHQRHEHSAQRISRRHYQQIAESLCRPASAHREIEHIRHTVFISA